jgi:putative FmdB family regulatory protein
MPTYDYRCTRCKHVFELFHSMTDDTPRKCPRCKSKAVRVPAGGAGLLFKGSGFYITDYRSKSYREKAKKEKGEGGSGGEKSGGEKSGGEKKGGRDKAGGEKKSGGEGRASKDS